MSALAVASQVTDPELPMLTLADLGVLREVVEEGPKVRVRITPTYSGCPAMATMRDDLVSRLRAAGYADVRVEVVLSPAWSSDLITERGRRALAAHGISPPGPAPVRAGPVPLSLEPVRRSLRCPRCGSQQTALVSEYAATACRAQYRCESCLEPFDHVKEH